MPQPSWLNTDPFFFEGGPVGVLLIHGFTGAPTEMRPMGEYLAARGLTVCGVRLPGHGTTPEELARIRREEWIAACEAGLQDLRARSEIVFVGGLSLGSLLTLWLGAHHDDLAGLILMAPAVKVRDWRMCLTPIFKYFMKYSPVDHAAESDLSDPEALNRVWCYDIRPVAAAAEVYGLQRWARRALPRITQPVLIFQGQNDGTLPPEAAQITYDRIGSTDKTLIWLEKSGHNILIDSEREKVWEESYAWIRARAGKHRETRTDRNKNDVKRKA